MNCTKPFFEQHIRTIYGPRAHFVYCYDTAGPFPRDGLFAFFDITNIPSLPSDYHGLRVISDAAWENGTVIKDSGGFFNLQNYYQNTLSASGPITFTLPSPAREGETFIIKWNSPKCECGAQSVGSNCHSSWCQMKELI